MLEVSGWPQVRWRMKSDDGAASIDLNLNLECYTLLPDNQLQNNLFAMWMAFGKVRGTVRYQGSDHEVDGDVFYDHPRIVLQQNAVAEFGWNVYLPVALDDGSYFAAHHTRDSEGCDVINFCFAVYVDGNGASTWLPQALLLDLQYDTDEKPQHWKLRWRTAESEILMEARAQNTRILKAWGRDGLAQTRLANPNIPIVFDATLSITDSRGSRVVRGSGLAEFMKRAAWF